MRRNIQGICTAAEYRRATFSENITLEGSLDCLATAKGEREEFAGNCVPPIFAPFAPCFLFITCLQRAQISIRQTILANVQVIQRMSVDFTQRAVAANFQNKRPARGNFGILRLMVAGGRLEFQLPGLAQALCISQRMLVTVKYISR